MDTCAEVPYSLTNAPNDPACARGGRKPVFALGMMNAELHRLADAYEEWAGFAGDKDGLREGSVVLVECYGTAKMRAVPDAETSFPWREVDVHV
jgi:hypothetical protein